VDELAQVRSFRASVSDPSADVVAAARRQMLAAPQSRRPIRKSAIPRRRILIVVIALTLLLGGAGVVAAGLFGDGILTGPQAPKENDAALQALFPPFHIGHATELATFDGRKLFGAHTASGGYCFSATSPTDPKGEGGHCVSAAEAQRLDNRQDRGVCDEWLERRRIRTRRKQGPRRRCGNRCHRFRRGERLVARRRQTARPATSKWARPGIRRRDEHRSGWRHSRPRPLMKVHRVRTPSGRLIGFSFALD